MQVELQRLVLVTLLPGQVIMAACAFCHAPLAFEPVDGVTKVARCMVPKCVKAREKIT